MSELMPQRIKRTFFFLIGIFLLFVPVCHANTANIPGTQTNVDELVRSLKQTYHITSTRLQKLADIYLENGLDAIEIIRFDYISDEPYRQTKAGKLFLKFSLTAILFKDQITAETQFRKISHKAHPDIGMSYEWDHLFLKETTLYHLHLPCIFSETTTNQISTALEKILPTSNSPIRYSMKCRCGGGCSEIKSKNRVDRAQ